jgi:hypothetical protein
LVSAPRQEAHTPAAICRISSDGSAGKVAWRIALRYDQARMGQMTMTDTVRLQLKGEHVQLTVHRKVTSVDPGFRIVSPIVVKDIFSASGPPNTTLTSSTGKS